MLRFKTLGACAAQALVDHRDDVTEAVSATPGQAATSAPGEAVRRAKTPKTTTARNSWDTRGVSERLATRGETACRRLVPCCRLDFVGFF